MRNHPCAAVRDRRHLTPQKDYDVRQHARGLPSAILAPFCNLAPFLNDHHLCRMLEQAVAPAFAVMSADLWTGTRGAPDAAFARQVAMYLAHVESGLNYTEVGRLFARDRTTVAHACILVESLRDDAAFDRTLELLEGALRLLAPRRA